MTNFSSFSGRVVNIERFSNNRRDTSCNLLFSITDNNDRTLLFIVTPSTYFLNHVTVHVGDCVDCFYDPRSARQQDSRTPAFCAIVIAIQSRYENVIVDFFNRNLVNQNRTIQLNLSTDTLILLTNAQEFIGNLGNRNLVVVYACTTRNRLTRIVPTEVVVLC